eukprot:3939301-Rhodomonas_salina.1
MEDSERWVAGTDGRGKRDEGDSQRGEGEGERVQGLGLSQAGRGVCMSRRGSVCVYVCGWEERGTMDLKAALAHRVQPLRWYHHTLA